MKHVPSKNLFSLSPICHSFHKDSFISFFRVRQIHSSTPQDSSTPRKVHTVHLGVSRSPVQQFCYALDFVLRFRFVKTLTKKQKGCLKQNEIYEQVLYFHAHYLVNAPFHRKGSRIRVSFGYKWQHDISLRELYLGNTRQLGEIFVLFWFRYIVQIGYILFTWILYCCEKRSKNTNKAFHPPTPTPVGGGRRKSVLDGRHFEFSRSSFWHARRTLRRVGKGGGGGGEGRGRKRNFRREAFFPKSLRVSSSGLRLCGEHFTLVVGGKYDLLSFDEIYYNYS